MLNKIRNRFMELSRIARVGLVVATLFGLSVVGSAPSSNSHQTTLTTSEKSSSKQQDVIEHKTISVEESLPFDTTTVDDSSLAKGSVQTRVEGVNGIRTHTYDVTYTNGDETARTEISSIVTTPPVSKVVANGTYVTPPQPSCPNGTYVNTYGNTVCSPYVSSSAPAGATAQCVDGTYSFSQSRSGTCSHHGGVASWL